MLTIPTMQFPNPEWALEGEPRTATEAVQARHAPLDAILRQVSLDGRRGDRRACARHAFSQWIRLIPLDRQRQPLDEQPIGVVGREISAEGLGFYHTHPLPHRFVIAEFPCRSEPVFRVLLRLTWCRFLREGWYESGGRFLELLSPPRSAKAG